MSASDSEGAFPVDGCKFWEGGSSIADTIFLISMACGAT